MNEKKILFAFGCPNRDLTVERLLHATALAVDPTAKNEFFILAVKLSDEEITDWYHNFYYNMHLDLERMPHHKYLPDDTPAPVELSIRAFHKRYAELLRRKQERSTIYRSKIATAVKISGLFPMF